MIVKLPIIINSKVVYTLFTLTKYEKYFILSIFENITNNISITDNNINKYDLSLIILLTCNNINVI